MHCTPGCHCKRLQDIQVGVKASANALFGKRMHTGRGSGIHNRMTWRVRILIPAVITGLMVTSPVRPAENPDAALDRQFEETVRPFVNQFCFGCHGIATPAAQFDLRVYSSAGTVRADLARWRLVIEKLSTGQMPPAGIPKPSEAVRQKVVDWIRNVTAQEARKHDGDPGPVLTRRLSNSEYNNSIRDLTGADIQPAREFPVDPANTEGFDNSGESLVMSPGLFNKYLQAARQVSEHMVLKPDGFDFAPYPMLAPTDRDRYTIQRILDFYARQPTDYAAYFEAAWRYRYRAALGKPAANLADFAAESKVSAKYLALIWKILREPTELGKPEVGPVATLQAMWRTLPTPAENHPVAVRNRCAEMRNFTMRIRSHTSMQFAAPVVRGLPPGSQPLLNWKLRQFNLHRREFDPLALRNDNEPEAAIPNIPRYPGLHQEAGPRWAALMARGRWGDEDLIVPAAQRTRYEAAFARFASVFPDVFYVSERGRYFPDDSDDKGRFLSAGYHNVMGFWRDDVPLMELILDAKGQKELNGLWDEFDFIADHTARTWDQFYFNQSGAVDTGDPEEGRPRPLDKAIDDPAVIFEIRDAYLAKAKADSRNDPMARTAIEYHFQWINDTLRRIQRMRIDAEPSHVDALIRFAARAYRRPLTPVEQQGFRSYYQTLRQTNGLTHEEAIRDLIVSVLISPNFCYRLDLGETTTRSTTAYRPILNSSLASRLSYFLWSSMPDRQLLAANLQDPAVLLAQTRRMLKDPRAKGLALEFGGNWLDFRRFQQHNAVDRGRFPAFTNDLREAMFQEPVHVLEDMIRKNRSVLDLIYGDYTFVNAVLAKHYGMPEPASESDWARVDHASQYARGSLFTMAAFLTQNAPGLRTSPVKRGYWVVRRILGEIVPPPPPSVPELPKDEAAMDLPLRDMLALHRQHPACASCHARFDTFGLALENYGPVGERREKDLAGRRVETDALLPGGVPASGVAGIQDYIRQHRQDDYLDNLCRKLLSFALGRSLLISDEPLLTRMRSQLAANGYRFGSIVDSIVTSKQFLNARTSAPVTQKR
jgi:mono/diheme cytochrome c family protein